MKENRYYQDSFSIKRMTYFIVINILFIISLIYTILYDLTGIVIVLILFIFLNGVGIWYNYITNRRVLISNKNNLTIGGGNGDNFKQKIPLNSYYLGGYMLPSRGYTAYFNVSNIKKITKPTRFSKEYKIEHTYVNNESKVVCIELKNPLKPILIYWGKTNISPSYNYKPISNIFISLKEPDLFIEDIKSLIKK